MISDDELDALPDDPEAAFVMFEGILRDQMEALRDNSGWNVEREYATYILAFSEDNQIDFGSVSPRLAPTPIFPNGSLHFEEPLMPTKFVFV